MARPILDALKSGNIQELYKVDDVLPVDYDTLLRVITNKSNQPAPIRIQTENPQGENVPASNDQEASLAQKPASPIPPAQKVSDASPEQTETKVVDSLVELAVQGRKLGIPLNDLLRQNGYLPTENKQQMGGSNR